MEQSGFAPEDFASDPIDILPDNVAVYELFRNYSSQWRCGPHGPIGLDYLVFFHRMDRMKLAPDEYDAMELDLHVMENEALRQMRQQ